MQVFIIRLRHDSIRSHIQVHNLLHVSKIYRFVTKVYINITITILGIIYNPISYLKHDVPETGFCPSLQVEPTR
jgi:hypothetical protein